MAGQRADNTGFVSATEVASYVYCQESWRLTHVVKQPSGNVVRMAQGEKQHVEWQDVERSTSKWRIVGVVLIVIAALGLLIMMNA